jgi:hypothetical protein
MKAVRLLSFAMILLSATLVSCEKDNDNNPDKPLTKAQILVKHAWQLDEVLINNGGQNGHYVRNVENSTGINYDAVKITFSENGTGTYTTDQGQTFPATWKFTTSDGQNMEFSVSYPSVVTYKWNLVVITEKEFHNTTAVSSGGSDLLVSARYVPVSLMNP